MRVKHSGNLGDIVYSLPAVKALCQIHQADRADYYIEPNVRAAYHAGNHPLGNVRIDEVFARKLFPLLKAQPYIGDVGLYTGGKADFDLDEFRATGFDYGRGNIARYYCHAFLCNPDLAAAWLDVEPDEDYRGKVLVNRTWRYRNPRLSYRFLAGRPGVTYVGLSEEYRDFARDCPRVPHVEALDFLALARMIKACRLFVGNQSFPFALAEALKVPRVLEVFPAAPNVVPVGPEAWEAWTQPLFVQTVNYALR